MLLSAAGVPNVQMKLAERFSQVLVHWYVRVAFIGKILNENVINNPLIDFAIYYFQIPKKWNTVCLSFPGVQ